MTIEEAFELADSIHVLIVDESIHRVNYLTLECLGAYDLDGKGLWAASFDSKIDDDPEWFEAGKINEYKFSARASTPAEAIRLAAAQLVAEHEQYKGSFADFDLNLEVKTDA